MNMLVTLALLCLQSSAGSCTGASYLNDEVSLVQTVMKHGDLASKKGNPVDWKAETAAEPSGIDEGAVTSAYSANGAKVADKIVAEAAEDLKFEDEVNRELDASRERAQKELDGQSEELDGAVKAGDKKVQETIEGTEAVADAAEGTVDKAKENWEAHEIK